MAISDARRHDLYNGLNELLGTERADTLMAYLPKYETTELATRDDIQRLEERFEDRFERVEDRLDGINERLDRFFLTQSAGLIAIVGTLIAATLL